ncbi:thiolase family protein [Streptomyces sp. NBC_01613]|uniref:thiolase family protein n=1 Tax=Streptomyces sp. NBC_01613 TaxID=2975896 RepID=UPI00386A7599
MRKPVGRDVVVVGAVRTAIGRGHPEKGWFRDVHPATLLGRSFSAVLERSGVAPTEVDDVIAGCVQQIGEQGCNVARNAWLQEGLPVEVPATTVDRQCGSGQQAVNFATAMIASGAQDVVVAGGVEHMGHLPFAAGVRIQEELGRAITPEVQERYGLVQDQTLVGQGNAAEMIAERWDLSRPELDELAVRSHRLAHLATQSGAFRREIVEIGIGSQVYDVDQGIRPDTNITTLAGLRPVFRADGRTTAATSSQVADGASAVLLMSADKAAELGVRPRARIVDQAVVGVDPQIMLTGPIPATHKILDRNGLTVDDLDTIEINEAFASVVGAWLRELKPDLDRVNPRGGAMALGHPLGATGARLITTLLHQLEDTDREIGLVTMCCGGGLGTATLLQRL